MSIVALGTDMPNTTDSILFSADQNFYLLSCPEGTQRYCAEVGCHFSRPERLKLVVLTDITPSAIMGFPSVYMALADTLQEENSCTLSVLTSTLEKSLAIQEWWKHCTVAFRSQHLRINFCHTEWKDDRLQFRFTTCESLQITFAKKQGTFLPEEATQLGVHKTNFSLLKDGVPVKSDIEPFLMVYPEQVLAPAQEERRITYCSQIPANSVAFEKFAPHLVIAFFENSTVGLAESVKTIFTPVGTKSLDYWLFDRNRRSPTFLNAFCVQKLLHASDPLVFPVRFFDDMLSDSSEFHSLSTNVYFALPGITYEAYDTKKKRRGTFISQYTSFETVKRDVLSKVRQHVNATQEKVLPRTHGPYLYVLGSGCAVPSIFRNVSCAMLATGDGQNRTLYIIDCGEGSLGQLSRVHDPTTFFRSFSRIIFAITHGHADHHFGMWSVLRYINAIEPTFWKDRTLKIYIPEILRSYAHWMFQFALRYESQLEPSSTITCLPPFGGDVEPSIRCTQVLHSADPYGYIITIDGKDYVFSGDTRPSTDLIKAGTGAEFLLHEATFLDAEATDAISKMHSTVSEALEVRKQMRAKNCLLTHFSQKYIKRTSELIGATKGVKGVACAIDLIRIDLSRGIPEVLRSNVVPDAIECVRKAMKLRGG